MKDEKELDSFVSLLTAETGLSPEEIASILFKAAVKTGSRLYLRPKDFLKEKYAYPPVPPEKWIGDSFFCGSVAKSIYPLVRDDFLQIFTSKSRPLRVVLGGGIGWGKTFLSAVIMVRLLYELGCLVSPQAYYGLNPTSYIILMNMSVSAYHARRVLFQQIRDTVLSSEWFRLYFRPSEKLVSVLQFPQKFVSFVPGSSSVLAPLGQNLFGGVIEEANSLQVSSQSKKIKDPAELEWDQAKKIHDAIWRRMKSRFQKFGRVPGMLVINSSPNHPDDFIERIKRENDSETLVIEHASWETKPSVYFSGQKFQVYTGGPTSNPRIIESEADRRLCEGLNEGMIIEVPLEFKPDFERNLEGALKDLAGINVRAINRFLTREEKIRDMFDSSLPFPFSPLHTHGIRSDELQAIRFEELAVKQKNRFIPKLSPLQPRFCHIDLGLTTDATGFCVVHIEDVVERKVMRPDGESFSVEQAPVIVVDFIAKIVPALGGEVDLEEVRNLIYELQVRCGFQFARITYDQFQSRHSQQLLIKKFGPEIVGQLSVTKTMDAYNTLKEAIYEGRLRCYPYEPLRRELANLLVDTRTRRVDHPPNGSKDVTDALAGAVFSATASFRGVFMEAPQVETHYEASPEECLQKEAEAWLLGVRLKGDEADEFEIEIEESDLGEL